TELRDSTFYAELHLHTAAGDHIVSSRPSDAVALAARTGTTIFCSEAVLDEAAYPPDDESPEEAEEVGEQVKEFIDSVNPEDCASWRARGTLTHRGWRFGLGVPTWV